MLYTIDRAFEIADREHGYLDRDLNIYWLSGKGFYYEKWTILPSGYYYYV